MKIRNIHINKEIEQEYQSRANKIRSKILDYIWYSILFLSTLPVVNNSFVYIKHEDYISLLIFSSIFISILLTTIFLKYLSFKTKAIGISIFLFSLGYISILRWGQMEFGYIVIALSTLYLSIFFGHAIGFKTLVANFIATFIILLLTEYDIINPYNVNSIILNTMALRIIEFTTIFVLITVTIFFLKRNTDSLKNDLIDLHWKTKDLSKSNQSYVAEIIKRKKVQIELEEEKDKYHQLFAQSLDSIIILKEERIVSCNEKTLELFECSFDDIRNTNVFEYTYSEQKSKIPQRSLGNSFIAEAYKDNYKIFEWRFISKRKTLFYAEVCLSKIFIKDCAHIQCIIRNITDRKQNENVLEKYRENLELQIEERTKELKNTNEKLVLSNERLHTANNLLETEALTRRKTQKKLEELNNMKDQLFSIIGHDLRNPFNNIITITSLLLNKPEILRKDTATPYIQHVNISALNAYNLLENLLYWAKNQTGNSKLNPTKVQAKKLVETCYSFLKITAAKKGIQIEVHIDSNHYTYADEYMQETILRNLISNAIKFTNRGGKIIIKTEKNKNKILFSVSDNGIGIPQNSLKDLFSVGKAISTPGTNGESGTGLGLVLCKEFTELNKGNIWVESVEGKGTTFYLNFLEYVSYAEYKIA